VLDLGVRHEPYIGLGFYAFGAENMVRWTSGMHFVGIVVGF
jgi:hypothetical protein